MNMASRNSKKREPKYSPWLTTAICFTSGKLQPAETRGAHRHISSRHGNVMLQTDPLRLFLFAGSYATFIQTMEAPDIVDPRFPPWKGAVSQVLLVDLFSSLDVALLEQQ